MEVKYKDKPSELLINQYCRKLEEFLSSHNISISIELWDYPLRIESYLNDKLIEIKNIWIKDVIIESPKFDKLSVRIMDSGIDEQVNEKKIWNDAWDIQNQIYRYLNLKPALPSDLNWKNDPYWKLWDYLDKLK